MLISQQHRTVHVPSRALWKALRWEPSGSTEDFVSPETKHVVSNGEFLSVPFNHEVTMKLKGPVLVSSHFCLGSAKRKPSLSWEMHLQGKEMILPH